MRACVRACVRVLSLPRVQVVLACVRACVGARAIAPSRESRACVRSCVRACVRACGCMRPLRCELGVRACVRACVHALTLRSFRAWQERASGVSFRSFETADAWMGCRRALLVLVSVPGR